MTAQDRVAVLDGALGRGYEDFDGLILAERSRAQRQSNEAGGDPAGLYSEENQAGGAGGMPGVQIPGQGEGQGGQGPQGTAMPGGVIARAQGLPTSSRLNPHPPQVLPGRPDRQPCGHH